ncbi:MAG: hypothetical protein KY456_06110 [Chloroflexi bacterium]|nr:hypothetical protein [Chloroflexota bacterium]
MALEDTPAESTDGNDSGGAAEPLIHRRSTETESVTSEVIVSAGPENRPTPATELLRAEAGDVRADMVTMDRAGAEQVTAERVVMTNSGARTVDTRSAQVDHSGVLAVRSDKAVFYNSTAIAVATDEARIVRGRVLLLKADRATIEGDARIAVYAGTTSDSVRPLVDVRGAAAFGVGMGAGLLFFGSVLRRLFRGR